MKCSAEWCVSGC